MKEKLKLSISGASKKQLIVNTKSQSKNTVVIEKDPQGLWQTKFSRVPSQLKVNCKYIYPKKTNFSKPSCQ